jgi:hypothetical protein
MRRTRLSSRFLCGLLAALALAPAAARAESDYGGSFDLRVGGYKPNIDEGLTKDSGGQGPYQRAFGGGHPLQFRLDVARALPWRRYGTFEVGAGAGYWRVSGRGTFAGTTTSSPDKTALSVVPVQLALTYRLDTLWEQLHIPLVPYARVSLDRANWWITNGAGKTVQSGATNGWAWGGGVAFVLDVVDPGLGRELDLDTGINHTMVFVDVAKAKIDDFGSRKSMDFSDTRPSLTFGLLFVF